MTRISSLPVVIVVAAVASLAQETLARSPMYHPGTGRFLQRDPLGYVDGMNQYEYVASNPVANVDPFGESLACCVESIAIPERGIRLLQPNFMRFGHEIQVSIRFSWGDDGSAGPAKLCTIEWWVRTDVPYDVPSGQVANTRQERFTANPGSEEQKQFDTKMIDWVQFIAIKDQPGLGRRQNNRLQTRARYVEFAIKVKSGGSHCLCASADKTITARQDLFMINGREDPARKPTFKVQSLSTLPPGFEDPPPG